MGLLSGIGKALGGVGKIFSGLGNIAKAFSGILNSPLGNLLKAVFPPLGMASGVLAEILGGRGLPQRDVVARAAENADIADALTREQSVLLRAVDALPRVEIRGGAGSGWELRGNEPGPRWWGRGAYVGVAR